MKKLHIVSILDRSGSMSGTEQEVIGAYNSFIDDQRKIALDKGIKTKATLVLFDDKYEKVYSKVPLSEVPQLDSSVYFTRGMTALYDAIGKTVKELEGKKNVIFFIETDGYENTSREFNLSNIRQLVTQKQKDGWSFNFVGADLSEYAVNTMGKGMGIGSTMAFNKSNAGYATRNASLTGATMAYVDTKS